MGGMNVFIVSLNDCTAKKKTMDFVKNFALNTQVYILKGFIIFKSLSKPKLFGLATSGQ
jgi:hypothetical protein